MKNSVARWSSQTTEAPVGTNPLDDSNLAPMISAKLERVMGGYGSGWQRARKTRVEECLVLSAALLQRSGAFRPSESVSGMVTMRNQYDEVRGIVDFKANLDATTGWIWLTESGSEKGCGCIPLVTTTLPWGGLRWWFLCRLGPRGQTVLADGAGVAVARIRLPSLPQADLLELPDFIPAGSRGEAVGENSGSARDQRLISARERGP
jgi:hypothetical protein